MPNTRERLLHLIRTRAYGLASGKVKERLGSLASEKAISLIAIHAHEIPQTFTPSALREAEAAKPATLDGREDWRDIPLVTIDPPDAKDHDDAVHAEPDGDPNNKGGYIVHVAIADVTYYVRPGSALDREIQVQALVHSHLYGLVRSRRRADTDPLGLREQRWGGK